jgi:hypothetical protein
VRLCVSRRMAVVAGVRGGQPETSRTWAMHALCTRVRTPRGQPQTPLLQLTARVASLPDAGVGVTRDFACRVEQRRSARHEADVCSYTIQAGSLTKPSLSLMCNIASFVESF